MFLVLFHSLCCVLSVIHSFHVSRFILKLSDAIGLVWLCFLSVSIECFYLCSRIVSVLCLIHPWIPSSFGFLLIPVVWICLFAGLPHLHCRLQSLRLNKHCKLNLLRLKCLCLGPNPSFPVSALDKT